MARHEQPALVIRADTAFRPLLTAFLDDTRADAQALTAALDRADAQTVQTIGHSLKGAGGGYGLDHITTLGAAIEQAALDGELDSAREAVRRLSEYLATVRVELQP